MSIEIKSAQGIAISDWDQYVEKHSAASPYHRRAWILSVEQAYAHQDASLVAWQDENVVGILPCVKMRRPLAKTLYSTLPFCDLGYCLANDEAIKQQLIDHMIKHVATDRPFEHRDTFPDDIAVDNLTGKKVRMVLPLPEDADSLFSSFKSKLRSQVRKAEKNGLTFKQGNSIELVEQFYQIFAENMRKLGSPVHAKAWFEAISKHYGQHVLLSIVYSDNLPIGGGLVLRNGEKIVIPWASTLASHNRLAPNMMLYWSLLKYACDSGCKQFDFGRSTFGEGTYKFKSQWGALPIPLNWQTFNVVSTSKDDNTKSENQGNGKLRTLVEQTWAKMPLNFTIALGPKIRKYISL
jgi:FemAB-related protein (PEP-CTERM system-associated)